MDTKELSKIDLNLLISLQILLEERNVSRAAERLFITQPAMSKTLSRLRAVFDDPLFTRSKNGMQPTPRAIELTQGLAEILGDISRLMTGSAFNPASFTGEITIALSEYIGVALLPRLVKKISEQAPHLNIRVITRVENQLEELAQGNLDFSIHIKQAHYGEDYRVELLGGSAPAILVKDTHPLTIGELSWERLAQYPLIRLYVSDWEQLEIQQESNALTPIVNHQHGILEISHLLTALEVLRETEYFMPAPTYILQNDDATTGIVGLPLPAGADWSINYAMVAHQRTANSPLHCWLWDEITGTIRELRMPLEKKIRQRMKANGAGPSQ
ncbi:MAG: DNA-binding transcriptional LysR family regulator [Halioglobus sp.]